MARNFNLRSVYLYLVCLITLIIFIFGTIFTIQRVVDLALDTGHYYMTLEDYSERFSYRGLEGKDQADELTEEEVEARYEKFVEQEKERARANHARQLASHASAMVVGGIFWVYHWKKIKNDE
ncbi:hypothetical protein [Alkaliphilus hydrothermalis]|uniref:Uncharacterized protein n=1 Tax=Alkaliphilus hydrothermalis TaxID=1482730 RepID=A0ABS2NT67_9FIRM|nr:hypothetical protein [Alkaliphilus hydrothermalis]MBM7616062.1 hypothetical protein [Alkaliphilus hydrothermalis]